MKKVVLVLCAITLCAVMLHPNQAQGHPGRTNAQGCHTNNQTGDRHCHEPGTNAPIIPSLERVETSSAEIVSIGDGDTLRVKTQGQMVTTRLGCIDAPELAQVPFGAQARHQLQELLPIKQLVQVRVIDRDRYDRIVAELFLGNQSINLRMVELGEAAVYTQYLNGCSGNKNQYLQSETQAKQQQLGFWNQSNPVMPWNFRQARKRRTG